MTSAINPPSIKCLKGCRNYSAPFSHLRNIKKHILFKIPQSRKVQEGSRKGNGKAKTETETLIQKYRNPARSRKVPGRETGRQKTKQKHLFRNTAIQQGPGRFQEGKREGKNRGAKNIAIQEGPGRFQEGFQEGKTYISTSFVVGVVAFLMFFVVFSWSYSRNVNRNLGRNTR